MAKNADHERLSISHSRPEVRPPPSPSPPSPLAFQFSSLFKWWEEREREREERGESPLAFPSLKLLLLKWERERRALQEYEQALKGGEVEVVYGRVTFLGPAEVGKTSLKHGLMNKPLPAVRESTLVASVNTIKPVSYQLARAGSSEMAYWKEVDDLDEVGEVAQLIARVASKNPVKDIKKEFLTPAAVDKFHPGAVPESSMVDKCEWGQAQSDLVKESVQKILKHAHRNPSPKIDPEVWLHVWDSGGQPVFLDVLPAFLTSRTMFLLLFNAAKGLKEEQEGNPTAIGRQTNCTELSTRDLLHQWMAVIYGHLAKRDRSGQLVKYPRIMLVGTHGDQVDQADKAAVKQEIESHCAKKLYSDMLYLPPLVVDNTTAGRGKNEDPGFEMIRQRVHEMTRSKLAIKTPVTWVLFRNVLKKLNKKVMQFSEVVMFAEECSIACRAVPAVLMFYHEIGALLFYPHIKSLQDVVITDPKWLVEQLGKLLTLKEKEEFDPNRTLWPVLFEKGIVLESLYQAVWKDCGIAPDALMDLLVHFLLAVRVPPTGQHNRSGIDKELFLPCVLKFCPDNPPPLSVSDQHQFAAPLFITFETLGFVPPGFFARLIPSLAMVQRHNQKGTVYKVNFSKPIYRNCITFSCQDPRGYAITLRELPHAFQISVIGDDSRTLKSLQSVCQELLLHLDQCCGTVQELLYGLHKTITTDQELKPAMNIRHKYALVCQSPNCCFPSPHYCDLTPGDHELVCTQDIVQCFPSQMCWLESEISSTGTTQPPMGEAYSPIDYDAFDGEPEMGNLMEWIAPEAASKWKTIGTLFKIPSGSLDSIQCDYPRVNEALLEVFTVWRRSTYSPYSWRKILNVLATDIVGHRRLADDIARRLSVTGSTRDL